VTFDQSSQRAYAFDYSDDKEVVDVEEEVRPLLQQPVRGRVPTAELTVHIVYESRRHRRLPDLSGTSCGRKYHSEFASVYREELTHANGKLCEDGCFTKVELAIADAEERERMGDP
jgi:hypothetical protein